LTVGANYYDIQVENSVVSPGAQFLINDCYVNERDGRSPFCDRIGRDDANELDLLDLGFINLNEDQVRGVDISARFGKEFTAMDRNFDYNASFRANHTLEVRSLFIGDDGTPTEDNDEGEFGFAKWTGSLAHDYGITLAVSNIFDREPPRVDSSEVLAVSNTPLGAGYNIEGRKFFVQLRKGF